MEVTPRNWEGFKQSPYNIELSVNNSMVVKKTSPNPLELYLFQP